MGSLLTHPLKCAPEHSETHGHHQGSHQLAVSHVAPYHLAVIYRRTVVSVENIATRTHDATVDCSTNAVTDGDIIHQVFHIGEELRGRASVTTVYDIGNDIRGMSDVSKLSERVAKEKARKKKAAAKTAELFKRLLKTLVQKDYPRLLAMPHDIRSQDSPRVYIYIPLLSHSMYTGFLMH